MGYAEDTSEEDEIIRKARETIAMEIKKMSIKTPVGGAAKKSGNKKIAKPASDEEPEEDDEDESPGKSKKNKKEEKKKTKDKASAKKQDSKQEPKRWSVDQVVEWLEEVNLNDFTKSFRKEEVDGLTLLKLEDKDLEEIGAPGGFKRKKLLGAIEKLNGK